MLRALAPIYHFGVLAPLGIAGAVALWPQRRRVWVLYLVVFGFSASVALFYIFSRYRFALTPPLTLLASAGLAVVVPAIRRREWKPTAVPAAALVVSAIFVNWPMEILRRFDPLPVALSNLGAKLGEERDYAQAESLLRRARSLAPRDVGACQNLGWVLLQQDKPDEAIAQFQQALELDPDCAAAEYQWGRALLEHGRPDTSIAHLERAVKLIPEEPAAYKALGAAYGTVGRADDAVIAFREAARLSPDDAEISFNLAVALSRSGHPEEAIKSCIRSVLLDPGLARAQTLYDKMTATPARAAIALAELTKALKEAPGDKTLLDLERRARSR
jgi:tetratricopeptide (TPR) repeat protein